MLAMTAATTAAGVAAQQEQAKSQRRFENKQYTATARAASQNYKQTISQTNVQTYQNNTAEGQQALANSRAIAAQQSQASVALGESGAGGNTHGALLDEFDRLSAENNFTLDTNRQWREQQTGQNLLSAQANANNQTTAAMPRPVQMPSMLSAALQIGSAAFTAYDMHQQQNMTGAYDKNKKAAF